MFGVLKEAEHRSTFYLPYWNLPLADKLVPRQVVFRWAHPRTLVTCWLTRCVARPWIEWVGSPKSSLQAQLAATVCEGGGAEGPSSAWLHAHQTRTRTSSSAPPFLCPLYLFLPPACLPACLRACVCVSGATSR